MFPGINSFQKSRNKNVFGSHFVQISTGDPNFNASGNTCMGFTRSKMGLGYSCNFGPAEQVSLSMSFGPTNG